MQKARNTTFHILVVWLIHNAYMLERFIRMFDINPAPQVIDNLFNNSFIYRQTRLGLANF